ncbi:MAG TPA: hypothetical protein VIL65_13950 [Beijerinckiaceae bacterium]|jgi:hypothetical protein
MSVIPCEQNPEFRQSVVDFAEVLKTRAHHLTNLSEDDVYQSGLFRAAIERIRGQYSATMREKREFVSRVLNYMQDNAFIDEWESSGEANRHDYSVRMPSGRTSIIELKGCLDGNNTNIFERPPHANEFIIWSVCTNPGADPRHNAWSGLHTRLSAEIISRDQRVDGVVVWDFICGTIGRPCPKIERDERAGATPRFTEVGPYRLPPACIYVLPSTIPSPRNNAAPRAQALADVHFLNALHQAFRGRDDEVNFVDFDAAYSGNDMVRKTTVRRGGIVQRESGMTAIQRL